MVQGQECSCLAYFRMYLRRRGLVKYDPDLDAGFHSPSSSSLLSPKAPRSPVILASDTHYHETVTSTPDSLKLSNGGAGFGARVKSLKIARRNSNDLIPDTPQVASVTAKLEAMELSGKWRIPRQAREVLETELHMDTHQLLSKLVVVAQNLAVPVISVFHVGAAALGVSGDVYLGPNVEVCSGLYSSNVCGFHYVLHAEQAAVLCALSYGEKGIIDLYCSSVPCGMCRQFMTELPDYHDIHLWSPQMPGVRTLGDLLPFSFGPKELGLGDMTLLTNQVLNPISLPKNSEAAVLDPELATAAEEAAQHAHSPYTNSYAGAVLRLKSKELCCGSSIESVAYNPSVSPLQMALLMLFARGAHIEDIEAACLAEDPSAPITYKGSDDSLLAAVAPEVNLWLIPLTRSSTDVAFDAVIH